MRPIVGAAVTCLSVATLTQSVNAQVAGDASGAEIKGLEEIVVTAQKREERLQDVPIAISVLGGDKLDSSVDTGVVSALARVPGVFTPITNQGGRQGGNASISIRGVSATTAGAGTTAYYLDGTPFGRAQNAFVPDTNPYDLDRVEVLRGPQGTLYGASALNGVVRVLTKSPNFQELEFKARGSVSTTEHGSESYAADTAFNIPLIEDKLAARVVLGYQELGGWIDKPFKKDANDTEKKNARMKLAARPIDDLSVGLTAWFSRTDSDAPPFSANGRTSPSTVKEPSNTDFDSYSLDVGYDTSIVSIKSTTSYLDYTLNNKFDFSPLPIPGNFTGNVQIARSSTTVFTEELVLNSVGSGPWRWTLGSMYRNAQDDSDQGDQRPGPRDTYFVKSKSVAVFGEVTRVFADGLLELTGGLRYFKDEVTNWEHSRSTGDANGIPLGGLLSTDDTFKKTTPRVVLTWHPSTDATVYTSYSKGFRSGLAQGFAVKQTYPDIPAASPDTLTNYEIGTKANTLGGRLTFDSAVYYMDWKGVQQDLNVLVNGVPTPAYLNGGAASGIGVDFAMMYAPIDSLRLGLTLGWNDLTYDGNVYNSTDPLTRAVVFPKGSRRSNSPKTTAGASVDYSVPLGSSGYLGRLSASGNYVSEQITGAQQTGPTSYTRLEADSLTLVRVGFTVEAPKHWSATLYVDNATDEKGIQPDTFSPQYDISLRPRTYGVQAEYKY